MSLKIVSLFCGCGGMDLGIQGNFNFLGQFYAPLPFQLVYAADHDPYAIKIYNQNFTHAAEEKDVRDINADKIPDHDILMGGFPCQSFSISAQNPPRLGYKDVKGMLFFEMVKILQHKKPRFFIAENVKGLLSANQKKAFPMIIQEFEQAGYYVKFKLLNAANFGVPQKRERIFIVGFRHFEDFIHFDFPTETNTLPNAARLNQVIDTAANDDEKWFFSQNAVNGMLRVQQKMNKGRAQNIDGPCNTVSSHLAKVSLNSTDPVLLINDRYRRFTPREAARIQSFPDDFQLDAVSENRQYRAIGNAVPPVLMWHIAQELLNVYQSSTTENSPVDK